MGDIVLNLGTSLWLRELDGLCASLLVVVVELYWIFLVARELRNLGRWPVLELPAPRGHLGLAVLLVLKQRVGVRVNLVLKVLLLDARVVIFT